MSLQGIYWADTIILKKFSKVFIGENRESWVHNINIHYEADKKQWPFTRESAFYLILNMGLGGDRNGSWPGPIDDSNLPAIIEVDWVRVSKIE